MSAAYSHTVQQNSNTAFIPLFYVLLFGERKYGKMLIVDLG